MKEEIKAPFLYGGEEAEKPHCKDTDTQQKKQDSPNIFRVGDKIMEKVTRFKVDGTPYTEFETRKRETIADRHGRDYLKGIPFFDSAVVVPSHTNYKQIIGNCWNLYYSLDYKPVPGPHPHWDKLMEQIFGEKVEMGWDYLTIAYREPIHILPILCLVSPENQTGKSTFGNALAFLFGRNVGFFTQDDLNSPFNSWIKHLFAIFEEISDAKKTLNKIKAMSTAQQATLNEKYQLQVSFQPFVKIVILSNNDKDLIKANEYDIRYWILRLHPLKKEDFIKDFENKLKKEVPAVMHKLSTRDITSPKRSRMWFDPELIKTETLSEVINNSHSEVAKEISIWSDSILETRPSGFGANVTEIYEALGRKYTRSEINTALKEELKIPSRRTTYNNHFGIRNNGQAYFFGNSINEPEETDITEDMPF